MKTKGFSLALPLTLLAFALCLPTIGAPISGDEAATFLAHWSYPWSTLFFSYPDPNNHNLFTALSRLGMQLFGEHEITFRLPVLLAGILSVPMLYRLVMLFFNSRWTAVLAACLLAFSYPHLKYSQEGRGYALSLFLALTMALAVIKLAEKKNAGLWGGLLIGVGVCLILTMPSNVHFLAAVAVFFLVASWQDRKSVFGKVILDLKPFLILFGLVIGYFILIYADLKRGIATVENYARMFEGMDTLAMTPDRLLSVLEFLVSPWGFWLYLLLAVGLIGLRRNRRLLLFFLCVFSVPLVLIYFSGIMGPPRVYIYWLPFVLILAAVGLTQINTWINKLLPGKMGPAFMTLFFIGMMVQPVLKFKDHFSSRSQAQGTKIEDAKQVLSYINAETGDYDLVVIPYSDRALRHYLEEKVADRMLDILKNGRMDKIIFVGQKDVPAHEIPLVAEQTFENPLKDHSFKLIKEIGGLRIYDFDRKIERFIPTKLDLDYEEKIGLQNSQHYDIKTVKRPKIVGEKALVIEKKSQKEVVFFSPSLGFNNLEHDKNYTLFIYAQKYQQKSSIWLVHIDEPPTPRIYLNSFYGNFQSTNGSRFVWHLTHPFYTFLEAPEETGSDFIWEIKFNLSAVKGGQHNFVKIFHLIEETSYFDGFQSFILHK